MPLTHDDILAALQAEYPRDTGNQQGGVYLVARLKDAAIGMDDPSPHIFLPDCHVVTKSGVKRFPRVTADEPQVAALERFLQLVRTLARRDSSLRFWQLGDFVDLWRVGEEGQSVKARMKAFTRDRDSLVGVLKDLCPGGLKATVLAGNHDLDLCKFDWELTLEQFIPTRPGGLARAHLFHGHQVDPIEALPQSLKEFFARGATENVPPAARTMLEATNPHWRPEPLHSPLPKKPNEAWQFLHAGLTADNPVPLGKDAVNVLEHTPIDDPAERFRDVLASPGSKVSADPPSQTFFSDAAFWADRYDQKGRDLRLAIIGHTHRPRIIRGKRAGNKPFVLMDCGAWVGTAFLSRSLDVPVRRSQFGVKVGNDLRIYQVEYRPAV